MEEAKGPINSGKLTKPAERRWRRMGLELDERILSPPSIHHSHT
jgi:hypothetical protein